MSRVTENDFKRLEELIIAGQKVLETRLDEMETRLDRLEKGQTAIKSDLNALAIGQAETKGEIKTLDAKIEGIGERIKTMETSMTKIPDLAEKVGELKNWRQIVIITLTALISSAITWVIRDGNLKP